MMNTFELDQPLDLRLKALNLSRGFSHHEPPKPQAPPPPPYSSPQLGVQQAPQNQLLMVNNMMLGTCGASPGPLGCNNKLVLTTTINTADYYQSSPPRLQSHQASMDHRQQQHHRLQQQQQQQRRQVQLTPTLATVNNNNQPQHQHQHHQLKHPINQPTPPSQSSTPLSSPNSCNSICNPAPMINQKQRSLNYPLLSPISSFKSSSPPIPSITRTTPTPTITTTASPPTTSTGVTTTPTTTNTKPQRQPPPTTTTTTTHHSQQQRNIQIDSSPSTPASSASPMVRQHSLISRYNCKPCGIVFSQPETLRAHQEGYCTKTNRNQLRSQSAGFALRHPADCEF